MQIIDNVLSEKTLNNIIVSTIRNNDFPWNLIDGVSTPDDGNYQFIHELFTVEGNRSAYDFLFKNLYYRLGVNKLWRSKINLTLRTKEPFVFYPFHTDFANHDTYTTAIFYLNTNNGYTLFEDGTKVDSVANRMVVFDGTTKHTGSTHTDGDRFRFVLNINFT
jgi:hypothetical protein